MRFTGMAAALCLATLSAPAVATVAPLTAEGRLALDAQQALHDRTVRTFGIGIIEQLRDPQKAYASVLVARQGARSAPKLVIRDELGWFEKLPRERTRRLPASIGRELDRLFADDRLWMENPFTTASACRGGALVYDLHHAGQSSFGRSACGAYGIAGRIASVALRNAVPAGPVVSIAPAGTGPSKTLSQIVFDSLKAQNVALGRRMLPGFVEVYAEDARIDLPTGSLVGERAILDWARSLQDWTGMARPGGMNLYQSTVQPQQGNYVLSTHEVRWIDGAGRPLRRTYSELWRNRDGRWQIVHQRVSPDKPATEGR